VGTKQAQRDGLRMARLATRPPKSAGGRGADRAQ